MGVLGRQTGGTVITTTLRACAISAAIALGLSGLLGGSVASADTLPSAGVPQTVTTDALPTAQINGVVWSQVVAGSTVFAGGEFSSARPAGVALGGPGQVARGNLMSYDITTGALLAFSPMFNGVVKDLALSPDGQTLYVAGSFTTVDGADRYRLAAFNVGTGALLPWQPTVNSTISGIAVTEDLVYLGGQFTSVDGQLRDGIAAVSRAASAAVNSFSPTITGGDPQTIAVSPDRTRVVVGGNFTAVNGSSNPGYGLAMIDASTSASLPMQANSIVRNGDQPAVSGSAAILELVGTDAGFYGVGYTYNRVDGNLEGSFKADWNGNLVWLEDCHGDSYSIYPDGDAVYQASHAHYCGNVGGFPQTNPWTYQRAQAFSDAVKGTVGRESLGYYNFEGQPRPDMLHWFPDLVAGTFTGQTQAAWSVSGNDQYVVFGGEFPTVNGVAQQGLVRFAKPGTVTPKVKPTINYTGFVPTFLPRDNGQVRLGFAGVYDRDNELLNYRVYRDSQLVYETQASSKPWSVPNLSFVDSGLVPGQTYTYSLRVNDFNANAAWGAPTTYTYSAGAAVSGYSNLILNSNPRNYWPLNDSTGQALDVVAGWNANVGALVTRGSAGAIFGSAATAFSFNATNTSTTSTVIPQTRRSGEYTFSVEAWFKTTSTRGGAIASFSNALSGSSSASNVDRVLYLANDGRIYFGINPTVVRTVNSAAGFNNGAWHHVVGQVTTSGMQLFVDGALVAGRTDANTPRNLDGVWRIGGDRLSGWTSNPSNSYLNGQIDEVAVYRAPLTAAQVNAHYVMGTQGVMPNQPPTAAVTATLTDLTIQASGAGSSDPDGTIATYAWDFGDGATGTGPSVSHTYAAAGTYTVTLTVTDNGGGTASTTYPVTVEAPNTAPTAGLTLDAVGLNATFDGSASTDSDGTVTAWAWDFGDGSVGSGQTAAHTYAANGTYTVSLTVTDNDGATSVAATQQIIVNSIAPTASFTATQTYLGLAVDASASSDPDGTVASYAWSFGDGATGTGTTASHGYAAPGTYTVTLVVTDNAGVTSVAAQQQVTAVQAPNVDPTAAFESTVTGLSLVADADDSVDSDGSVVDYAWTFGDGSTGTGKVAEHRYEAAGTYTVTLTISDNRGGTDEVSHEVTVAPIKPTASFTAATDRLQANFDASGSTDSDGTVEGYSWDFGDGTSGHGATPGHTYATAGTYTVTLTVTDNDGASDTVSKPVSVTEFVVKDAFDRVVTRWGVADTGGTWTYVNPSYFTTDGDTGVTTLPSAGARGTASLTTVSARDVEVQAKISVLTNTTGSGVQNTYLVRVNGNSDYRLTVQLHGDKSIRLNLTRVVGGTATNLGDVKVTNLTYATGDVINVRFTSLGNGTTALEGKVWKDGSPEPAAAQLIRSDSSAALQAPGSFAISNYLTGSSTTTPFVVRQHEVTVTAR